MLAGARRLAMILSGLVTTNRMERRCAWKTARRPSPRRIRPSSGNLATGMAERVTESGRAVLEKPSHRFVETL
jgi:hypothetical protein